MASPADIAAMRRALDLACTPGVPLGPNPRVGCVLLDEDGGVVADGYHRGEGHPHAEVEALRAAGDSARGCTAVVTLEPCNHIGRTGPCSTALRDAGIVRVVYAQPDANPVARGGAEALRTAGLDVEGGVLADDARDVNPEWTFAVDNGRPFVTWKFAATLDGRSAATDGASQWITSPEARADVHRLRAESDAILVGTGTVLADDPRLTVRDGNGTPLDRRFQPLRVVMGMRPIAANAAVADDTAESLRLRTRDPGRALTVLFGHGRQRVWLEGGPTLAAAFVRAGLVDRTVAYLAPALLGAGPAAVGDLGVATVADAVQLELTDVTQVGPDLRITAQPRKG
jgi:diaminohydroxyphosphoribosylaminopyrimidine deaminase / 5-amino-6-(5-phosphoribosylamino)uracil reductase